MSRGSTMQSTDDHVEGDAHCPVHKKETVHSYTASYTHAEICQSITTPILFLALKF